MLAKVNSGLVIDLEAVPVTVEVDIATQGLPNFTKGGNSLPFEVLVSFR